MKASELLIKAKELISDPEYWCQGKDSADVNGTNCHPLAKEAYCFCAYGAVIKSAGHSMFEQRVDSNRLLKRAIDDSLNSPDPYQNKSIGVFNDEHTHKEVLAIFDKAIEFALKENN